jgi:putative transposase
MVRAFKSFSARRINVRRKTAGTTFRQRGFYEHVIRGEIDLNRIRAYIRECPVKWMMKQTDSIWGETT